MRLNLEELCHKRTLLKCYAERHCQIVFARKIQAAYIARFGDMVCTVLPKWLFISVMMSHFENQIISSPHNSYLNIDIELFASIKTLIFYILQFELKKLVKKWIFSSNF